MAAGAAKHRACVCRALALQLEVSKFAIKTMRPTLNGLADVPTKQGSCWLQCYVIKCWMGGKCRQTHESTWRRRSARLAEPALHQLLTQLVASPTGVERALQLFRVAPPEAL